MKKKPIINPIDKTEPTLEGGGLNQDNAGISNSNFGPDQGDDKFGDNLDTLPNDKPTNSNKNGRRE